MGGKMQSWVQPLLRQLRPDGISEESYECEISQVPFVWRRIANLFLHRFESEGMELLLGSVLSDLPRSAFDRLFEIRPFFILLKSAGLVQQIHAHGDVPLVIFSQAELENMNWSQRRGVVAHEFAHLILDHVSRPFSLTDPYKEKMQLEADDLCREWGLQDEIKSVRLYLKQKGEEHGSI